MSKISKEAFNEILDIMEIPDEIKIKHGKKIEISIKGGGNPIEILMEMVEDKAMNREQLAGLAFLLGATVAKAK